MPEHAGTDSVRLQGMPRLTVVAELCDGTQRTYTLVTNAVTVGHTRGHGRARGGVARVSCRQRNTAVK